MHVLSSVATQDLTLDELEAKSTLHAMIPPQIMTIVGTTHFSSPQYYSARRCTSQHGVANDAERAAVCFLTANQVAGLGKIDNLP